MITSNFWLGGCDSESVVGQNHDVCGVLCWNYLSTSRTVPSKLFGAWFFFFSLNASPLQQIKNRLRFRRTLCMHPAWFTTVEAEVFRRKFRVSSGLFIAISVNLVGGCAPGEGCPWHRFRAQALDDGWPASQRCAWGTNLSWSCRITHGFICLKATV